MTRRKVLLGGTAALMAATACQWSQTVAVSRAALAEHPELTDLIRFATLAASSHNTQPWRFRLSSGRVDILPDFSRRTPAVDPDDHHLFVSLGCAAENLALAAAARGLVGELQFDAGNQGSQIFEFAPGPTRASIEPEPGAAPCGNRHADDLSTAKPCAAGACSLAGGCGLAGMMVPQADTVNLGGNHVFLCCRAVEIVLGHFRNDRPVVLRSVVSP